MILNLCAPSFDPADSYGRLANELISGLTEKGLWVNQIGGTVSDALYQLKPVLGGLLLGYPTTFGEYGALANMGPRIAITMFESTVLPDGWVENLNRMDTVVVPSTWCAAMFRDNGVTVPVHVIPLGVSKPFHCYEERPATTPFTFLAIADRGQRKAWTEVGIAFDKAFGDDPNYRLVLKARELPIDITNANIEVISGDYDDAEMAALYHRSHVMVFPSCGEGFGLPPRESAATGCLSLVTNWSGLTDDLHQWALPLPYDMTAAWSDKKEWAGRMGQWAKVDIDALAHQMKLVAEHYAAYRDFRVQAAVFCQTHYRWQLFVNRVHHLWTTILEKHYGTASRTNGLGKKQTPTPVGS